MSNKAIAADVVHSVPADLRKAFASDVNALAKMEWFDAACA